jgi:hypothetical protein
MEREGGGACWRVCLLAGMLAGGYACWRVCVLASRENSSTLFPIHACYHLRPTPFPALILTSAPPPPRPLLAARSPRQSMRKDRVERVWVLVGGMGNEQRREGKGSAREGGRTSCVSTRRRMSPSCSAMDCASIAPTLPASIPARARTRCVRAIMVWWLGKEEGAGPALRQSDIRGEDTGGDWGRGCGGGGGGGCCLCLVAGGQADVPLTIVGPGCCGCSSQRPSARGLSIEFWRFTGICLCCPRLSAPQTPDSIKGLAAIHERSVYFLECHE